MSRACALASTISATDVSGAIHPLAVACVSFVCRSCRLRSHCIPRSAMRLLLVCRNRPSCQRKRMWNTRSSLVSLLAPAPAYMLHSRSTTASFHSASSPPRLPWQGCQPPAARTTYRKHLGNCTETEIGAQADLGSFARCPLSAICHRRRHHDALHCQQPHAAALFCTAHPTVLLMPSHQRGGCRRMSVPRLP